MKEFQRVDKKAKTKWRLSRALGLVVLAVISAVVLVSVSGFGDGEITAFAGICCGVILLAQLINMIVYPIIEYIQWTYLIDDDRIEIKKGIFWRSHTVIPISRIQHVSYKSGPMQNVFGLASVEINTAGGVHSIDEVNKGTAQQICELLKNIVNLKVSEKRLQNEVTSDAEVITDA